MLLWKMEENVIDFCDFHNNIFNVPPVLEMQWNYLKIEKVTEYSKMVPWICC